MSINAVRALFKPSVTLLRPLCRRQVQSRINQASLVLRFRHYSTLPEVEPAILPNRTESKMQIHFTCKVCNTRNEKMFSKAAYTRGVVIIECDGCRNNHLIADNLKWFGSKKKNIEDILAEKGLTVQRGVVNFTGMKDTDVVSSESDPPIYLPDNEK